MIQEELDYFYDIIMSIINIINMSISISVLSIVIVNTGTFPHL